MLLTDIMPTEGHSQPWPAVGLNVVSSTGDNVQCHFMWI